MWIFAVIMHVSHQWRQEKFALTSLFFWSVMWVQIYLSCKFMYPIACSTVWVRADKIWVKPSWTLNPSATPEDHTTKLRQDRGQAVLNTENPSATSEDHTTKLPQKIGLSVSISLKLWTIVVLNGNYINKTYYGNGYQKEFSKKTAWKVWLKVWEEKYNKDSTIGAVQYKK